jgi:hypothetical protein
MVSQNSLTLAHHTGQARRFLPFPTNSLKSCNAAPLSCEELHGNKNMNTPNTTTEPVKLTSPGNAPLPEFGRWQDVQRLFGIKRGTLYNLINEGKVKSVLLRRKGNIHGCRLIHLASLSQYLNTLLETRQSL